MYTCGLTVYARGHIGNFRTFICVDVLRRTLKYLLGYQVRQVMNFTDVDDRTIAGAQKAGHGAARLHRSVHRACSARTRARSASKQVEETPRATDEANLAGDGRSDRGARAERPHLRSDGSIYFKISTLPDYGKLAHLDHEGMKPGARVDSDNYAKEDARDFVLWKATKPDEPTWDVGRSAGTARLAPRVLGDGAAAARRTADRHSRRRHRPDLSRITRTRSRRAKGATGKPFSRFWMHVEYLIVDEQKMSKSLGNTYTIPDVVAKGFRPSAVRYLLLSAHYRKQLNFTWASLAQAEEALRRLTDFLARLDAVTRRRVASRARRARRRRRRQAFADAMQDDLNTAAALGAMFELVRALNSAIDAGELGTGDVRGRPRGVRRLRSRARRPQPAAGRGRAAAGAGRGDRAAHRGAARRPPPPRLRRRRPHPRRSRGTRRASGRQRRRHTLEAEVSGMVKVGDVRSVV